MSWQNSLACSLMIHSASVLFFAIFCLAYLLSCIFCCALSICPGFSGPADSAWGSQACINKPGPVAVQQEYSAHAEKPTSAWNFFHFIWTCWGSAGLWPLRDTLFTHWYLHGLTGLLVPVIASLHPRVVGRYVWQTMVIVTNGFLFSPLQ